MIFDQCIKIQTRKSADLSRWLCSYATMSGQYLLPSDCWKHWLHAAWCSRGGLGFLNVLFSWMRPILRTKIGSSACARKHFAKSGLDMFSHALCLFWCQLFAQGGTQDKQHHCKAVHWLWAFFEAPDAAAIEWGRMAGCQTWWQNWSNGIELPCIQLRTGPYQRVSLQHTDHVLDDLHAT